MPKRPSELFSFPDADPAFTMKEEAGRRLPLSGEEALKQLERMERAAAAGDPASIAEKARRLFTEAPCAEQNRRALRLLRRASASRHPGVLHLLGLAALRGQGCARNEAEGLKLVEAAALLGCTDAQADAGLAHALGIGTPVSSEKSLYWRRLAAAAGRADAALEAARIALNARDFPEAARWYAIAADAGLPDAQYELALLFLRRDNPERNPSAARSRLRSAAEQGHVKAQYRLGVFYWSGLGGKVYLRLAVRWLGRAAASGSPEAAAMLADFFLTGNVFEPDRAKAWTLYLLAKSFGDASAGINARSAARGLSRAERTAARELLEAHRENPAKLLEAILPKDLPPAERRG